MDFVTKNFFRFMVAGAALAFAGVFVYAIHLEKYNVPPAGMKVPFGNTSGRAIVDGGNRAGDLADIAIQNMSGREIGMRLSDILAESLSFNKGDFVYNSASMEKYFTPTGFAQYRQFLQSTGMEKTLNDQNLQSGAYIELNPLELSSGVYGGVYKWLFEVPVTISFIPRDSESYRDEGMAPLNRRFLLRAQFTRVRDAADPEAVKIEIWQVLPPRDSR